MQVFIAGIMQGTRLDNQIDSQSYRAQISDALRAHIPDISIFDPYALNPNLSLIHISEPTRPY